MGLFGRKKTWEQLCDEYQEAVLAGNDKRVLRILQEKLKIAEAEDDMMKKLIVNSEWLSLQQRMR